MNGLASGARRNRLLLDPNWASVRCNHPETDAAHQETANDPVLHSVPQAPKRRFYLGLGEPRCSHADLPPRKRESMLVLTLSLDRILG
jgi:hypothetical protein